MNDVANQAEMMTGADILMNALVAYAQEQMCSQERKLLIFSC